jgi:hypothetical protein
VLVVLACVLAPLSILGVWTSNTLLDTDRYVDTVAPLAKDHDVQAAVSRIVDDALLAKVDVTQKVRDALPDKAAFVAPFVAQGIGNFVQQATLRILESDRFQNLWEKLNRTAHAQIVAILKNEGRQTSDTRAGRVVVKLGAVIDKVRTKLHDRGIDILQDVNIPTKDSQFVLFKSDGVRKVRAAADALDTLAIVLPILTALLFAAAVAISTRRRRTIVHAALGLAFSVGLLLTLFNLIRGVYLDAVKPINQDAAAAAYDQILNFLRTAARAVFAFAIIVAIGSWLAGPGKTATKIRTGVLSRVRGGEAEETKVSTFVAEHRNPLRGVVIGAGALLLVVLSKPTGLTVLVIALLVLVGVLVIEYLGRGASQRESTSV